eukprot:5303279-Amphidinium_carterae.2
MYARVWFGDDMRNWFASIKTSQTLKLAVQICSRLCCVRTYARFWCLSSNFGASEESCSWFIAQDKEERNIICRLLSDRLCMKAQLPSGRWKSPRIQIQAHNAAAA